MIKLMVHPKDEDESLLIQKAAFAAGYRWSGNGQILDYVPRYWITVRPEEQVLRQAGPVFTTKSEFTEKSVAEILRLFGARYDVDCTIPEEEA